MIFLNKFKFWIYQPLFFSVVCLNLLTYSVFFFPLFFSDKKMEKEDGLRTVECLRGRLIAERAASKRAKEDAEFMGNKVFFSIIFFLGVKMLVMYILFSDSIVFSSLNLFDYKLYIIRILQKYYLIHSCLNFKKCIVFE